MKGKDLHRLDLLQYLPDCSVKDLQVICTRLATELGSRGLPGEDELLEVAKALGAAEAWRD